MFERSLLSDSDMAQLGEAALTILERVGALYQSRDILQALESMGARVDYSKEVAKFPRHLVEDFLSEVRKETASAEASGEEATNLTAPTEGTLFHQLSQYFYDCEKRERRLGNRQDYLQLLKLGEVLHPAEGVGHCLLLSDVLAPVEPLEVTLLQFEYAHRPRGAYVQDVRQIDYLIEMEEISGVADLHWLANVGFSSPLRLGRDIADRYVHTLKLGRASNLYVMTVSGAGTPVTVAGCIALCAAELIANWMVGKAFNPKAPLQGCVWIATMDMKSGETNYLAHDALLRNFGVREFVRQWTGVKLGVGGGTYCPAKVPSLVAALENAYSAMTVAAFTGSHPGIISGHLDGGLTISPVQFLLDFEMSRSLEQLTRPIQVDAETLGLDTIATVAHAEETNYLATDHTLRHFRSELWLPELLERTGWSGMETEERVLRRAQKKVDDLLSTYRKPEVSEDLLVKLRAVVEKARKNLAGGNRQ